MKLGHIKLASIIAGISIFSAVLSTIWIASQDSHLQTGNLYFSKVDTQDLREIQINFPTLSITLQQEDNLWRVKEADYYYADFNLMHDFLNNIAEARINSQQTENITALPISLSLKNSAGQEIDYTNLSISDSNNTSTKVQRPGNKEIYTLNKTFTLPEDISSWTSQPFLAQVSKDIQQITLQGNKYYRKDPTYDLISSTSLNSLRKPQLNNFLSKLQYLTYTKVMSAQNFDDTKYPQRRSINIVNFNGLIRKIEILTDNQEYWVKQTFSTTPLPTSAANDYIKSNSFLYDGWYFRLEPATGKLLYANANG